MSHQTEEAIDTESLYDHERIAINGVMKVLAENIGAHRELGAFQREVRERFAEVGFIARCDFYEDDDDPRPRGERAQIPQITITGRTEEMHVGEFDHDRQGHEVRSNILGVQGQDNIQKTQVAGGFESRQSGLIVPKGE